MATVNLSWANPPTATDTGGTRTGFRLWRLIDAGGAPADAAALIADAAAVELTATGAVTISSASDAAATDTTAATGTTYYYVLKATNSAGDSGPALSGGNAEFATVVIA